ncbi:hypothetical protein LOC68_06290 [Blastopirellula sp. JC732]|uniref:Caspase family protein n=1 Tax=Blastopirellula sediminis TaxID=2894196 RepID=A0A9X1MJ14_9BACT|nr:hypothetical protein [Blastopirellula sediminis]MCC9609225.1 hypothetical protein [Blastopirellula sediminis]MCC9627998.1 hypothetical protein [Blastopirellula sediminis]
MVRLSSLLCAGACLVALPLSAAQAADHFLTVGGGPAAKSSQISLENNVLYFQRTLAKLGLDKQEHLILFDDGDNPQPDLQYEDVERGSEELRTLLAEIIGPSNGIRFSYRNYEIPGVSGAAEPEVIEKTLKDLSERLKGDDRLVFYFTGHGGKSKPESARGSEKKESEKKDEEKKEGEEKKEEPKKREKPLVNNLTHLWNSNEMTVTEWTEKLDQLPTETPVVAVMVQCYSGGFGNLIFKGGDPENGVAEHLRCGFFSTVPDRTAAGCTPNVQEAEYREYSSYFWEALTGQTRTGQSVDKPDYDGDGQCTLLEAHAYTVLTSNTIDIPTRTSDALLRHYSATSGKDGLLNIHSPIAALLASASACEREVIEGLSGRFELTGADRGKDAEEAIKRQQEEKKKLEGDLREKRQEQGKAKIEIAKSLQLRWPSLGSPWHPEAGRLITEEAETVKQAILEHEKYAKLKELDTACEELQEKIEEHDLNVVKLERLKYWLETRALAVNLPVMADEKVQKDYDRLLKLESQQLVNTPPAVAGKT